MTITVSQHFQDAAGLKLATGRYLDDAGSPAAAVLNIGFAVRRFRWVNLTDRIEWEWVEGMAAGTTLKTVAAGTRTLDTTDVAISPDAGSGNQTGGAGTLSTANAGVINNTAYPGPQTITTNTSTQIVGTEPQGKVTIAAAAILQSKQYTWIAEG